jgi:hypothetical protein
MKQADNKTADPTFLFGQLKERLNRATTDVVQRIHAHVEAVSGHDTITAFHANGASRDDKIALYRECLLAILKNDFTGLKGDVPPVNQVTVEVVPNVTPLPVAVVEPPEMPQDEPAPATTIIPAAPANLLPAPKQQAPTPLILDTPDSKVTALVEALKGLVQPTPSANQQTFDPAQLQPMIQEMVNLAVAKAVHDAQFRLLKAIEREHEAYKKSLASAVAEAIEEA